LLYYLSLDLKNFKGSKPEIEKQTGKAFHFVERVTDWLSLIAALYTINLSVDIALKAILEADKEDSVSRISKLVREQKEHLIYAEGWVQQLLEDSPSIKEKFTAYLDEFTPDAVRWLQSLEENSALLSERYFLPNASLTGEFERRAQGVKVSN
jgi:ring-1,2-phenylacetyl-CoA epoxidase subunit PaaC